MFSDLQREVRKRTFASMALSVAMHVAVLAIALHRPAPVFVRPSSVRAGQQGASATPVYFSQTGVDSVSKEIQGARIAALQYLRNKKHTKHDFVGKNRTSPVAAQEDHANQARSAGSPNGSLWEGSTTGFEIKPALPVVGPQPRVYTPKLPQGYEGDVIVEITIDEFGNITDKILLRGLGNGLDEEAISALQNWRFRPATRDGIAIPSKQDVYFHFVGIRS
jgi:TonB family protein